MTYLERRKNERGNPGGLLPGAKSVFCLGLSYNPRPEHHPLLGKHPVSCYAWGRDYHEVLNEKLEVLARYLCQDLAPGSHAKWFVDSGSILEKDFAALAGLGWIGKNTLLLNGKHGSFLFLGEILTDAELACDTPAENLCHACVSCLEACPTGALEEPGILNATKCISYLTHRLEFPPGVSLHGYLAGCDLCQAACPYNADAPAGREADFEPRPEIMGLTVQEAGRLTEEEFHNLANHSALGLIKYPLWKRNVLKL
jgi:epoxyqueuosine reductase